LAQESNAPSGPSQDNSKLPKDRSQFRGCVGRSTGGYILTKQDPGMTYELRATGKIKLRQYLGQRVEVTGNESPSMSTSSDTSARTGFSSPGNVIHYLNQDHQQGMHRAPSEDFNRRSANHVDYYCALRTRKAAKAGADCCRAHKSHGSYDSACLT